MESKSLTITELTARATRAAKMYRNLADQGVRPRSSKSIARHLEQIAQGDILCAAGFVHKRRSYLAEYVRAGIAVGVVNRAQVVIFGSGAISDTTQSKLYAAVQAAQALGGSGIYLVGERVAKSDTSGRYWLVFGPVVEAV